MDENLHDHIRGESAHVVLVFTVYAHVIPAAHALVISCDYF